MNQIIPKETLGLAGEFAVASELCRRGIYAQLTLGNRKRTDLLVETEDSMLRVQVKSKQKRGWPGVRGVSGADIILVLVDFENKEPTARPDFYLMNPKDWAKVINARLVKPGLVKRKQVSIDPNNVPAFKDGFVGMEIRATDVQHFKERWERIESIIFSKHDD